MVTKRCFCHCERLKGAKQSRMQAIFRGCFVASLLAMTFVTISFYFLHLFCHDRINVENGNPKNL